MIRNSTQLTFLVVAALAACKHQEPNYCPDVPVTHNCLDKVDADMSCMSNASCSGATPVCDLSGTRACVQCTTDQASACTGTTPVCGATKVCEACTAHTQCASGACLPDGSCGTDTNVAYVDPTKTDNATCTKDMPCTKVSSALATNRAYVKFTGTTSEAVSLNNRNVTFLADPGAKLIEATAGIVLEVKGSSQVTVEDLTLSDGLANGIGVSLAAANTANVTLRRVKVINNAGGGVTAFGGTLTVTQSTVASNAGGGISISGVGAIFRITNNFITRNGDVNNGTYGGIDLNLTSAAGCQLEFNSIVDNHAATGPTHAGGLICDISGFAAPNNIVARNSIGLSTTSSNSQTLGQCAYPTSAVQNDVNGLAFKSSETGPYDYHLSSGSTAIDQATTASTIAVDIDGDPRPQGAQRDQGADEFKP